MRKGAKAGEFAIRRVGAENRPGKCKQMVREAFDVPSKSGSARECWNNTKHKIKPKNINDTPAFVPAYFDTGKWGHAVLTVGKDKQGRRLCVSVDVQDSDHDGRKEIGIVPLEKLLSWGPFLGYGLDFDGVMVADAPTKSPAKPTKKPAPKPKGKSLEEIAREVLNGVWGNGLERKARLEKAGYKYAEVQDAVNALVKRR